MSDTIGEARSKCCNGSVLEFHLFPQKQDQWKRDWGEDIGPPYRDVTVCYTCRRKCEVEYELDNSDT